MTRRKPSSVMRLLLVVGLLLSPMLSGCATTGAMDTSAGKAKNVILFIGDGMGPSHFGAAWFYSTRVLGKNLRMVEVMNAGHTAYLVNDTADAIVAESAAAAGQIATGRRMTKGSVSMAADGKTPVQTIMEIGRHKGLATGLVTSSEITDATPAVFASHVSHRSDEASVAEQELRMRVEVLMGGGKQFFLPEISAGKRKDGRNLLDEAEASGYAVVSDAEELTAATGPKILGLFNMGNMAYEIDRGATSEPSLAEMTAKTLSVLSRNSKGFFAMIEGGRIDHAAHQNDAAGTIRDILAFDEAIGVAVDFARRNPDTLVVVTADHETAGMALFGDSREQLETALTAIQRAKASFEVISKAFGKSPTAEKIKEKVEEYLGIQINEGEARTVANDTIRKLDPANRSNPYLHTLAFVLRPYLCVGWIGQMHTASPLFAFGMGPGSERIKGLLHNTQLFDVIKAAME
ncbi:MAG: phoB1 [candidate division NC10 bacterium]|nr:phoB1 [candidate division NC10 bacterium]